MRMKSWLKTTLFVTAFFATSIMAMAGRSKNAPVSSGDSPDIAGGHTSAIYAAGDARPTQANSDPTTTAEASRSDSASDGYTNPSNSPDPDNAPRGEPAKLEGSTEKRRSLNRENESAKTLAEQGYDIEQNPPTKDNGKNPDYKINGEYADCYSPAPNTDRDQIRKTISDKVKRQAAIIVLNLDDTNIDINSLKTRLESKPVNGLQEIKIIKNGQIINFFPF